MNARLNLLSPSQIEELAERTAALLAGRGVEVRHEGMLERPKRAGAAVDGVRGEVRFPRDLQRQALECLPQAFSLGSPSAGGEQAAPPQTEQTLPYLLELCAARAGGKDKLKSCPLRFKSMDIEVILQACDDGLPVIGGTSPITTAGP